MINVVRPSVVIAMILLQHTLRFFLHAILACQISEADVFYTYYQTEISCMYSKLSAKKILRNRKNLKHQLI